LELTPKGVFGRTNTFRFLMLEESICCPLAW